MLAKCLNALRVLRLKDFGKQKFLACRGARTPADIQFAQKRKIFFEDWGMINVLYRRQYKFGADFPNNAT
ncbi:hypothetical protein [Rhizobium sp. CCGE 510]|uniref:hypothetical protein n=1 Tax=Rhizobium sp. CCGE 510 TaxID=1132836 RepID=UPI0012F6535A|nr:hypothetical protein [Rhizobium sp. CCGE 510]